MSLGGLATILKFKSLKFVSEHGLVVDSRVLMGLSSTREWKELSPNTSFISRVVATRVVVAVCVLGSVADE